MSKSELDYMAGAEGQETATEARYKELSALRAENERLKADLKQAGKWLADNGAVQAKMHNEREALRARVAELEAENERHESNHAAVLRQFDRAVTKLAECCEENERLRKALSWSFIRTLLSQGMSIQQDYDAGKYKDYEEVSARLDAAARERLAALEGKG